MMIVAVVALLVGGTPALAAGPSITAPTTDVRFLDGITFTGSSAGGPDVSRWEIVIDREGSGREIVGDPQVGGASTSPTLTYVLQTPGGALLPNTRLTAHFRATLSDGTIVDGPAATITYRDTRLDWSTRSGTFVTVHWTAGGAAFGTRAVQIADTAVRQVSDLLGVTESDPIDFFVYSDTGQFYDILGAATRENVGGEAFPDIRTLFANISPSEINASWVSTVIPHELTHLVFDTAVANPYHYPPRWLNEGLAVYESEGDPASYRSSVRDAIAADSLMPLDGLTGEFPTTADRFYLAYAESVSAVDFLVRTYGQSAMVSLVRSYAAGVTDDEAFRAALGTDVAGFQSAWLDSLAAAVPSPYGPQPAPAGPVPPGWGTAASAGPGGPATSAPSPSGSAVPATAGGGGLDAGSLALGAAGGLAALAILVLVLARANRPRGGVPPPG